MLIKQAIIKLCIDMIVFWKDLKKEIESIPGEDVVTIISEWDSYFQDNYEPIGELSDVKERIYMYKEFYNDLKQ